MKGKKQVFEISTTSGVMEAYGFVSEGYGIDKSSTGKWTLTHLGSGWICGVFLTKKAATEFAKWFSSEFDLDGIKAETGAGFCTLDIERVYAKKEQLGALPKPCYPSFSERFVREKELA